MSEGHSGSHLPVYKKVIGGLFLLTLVEFGISFWMHAGFPFMAGIVVLVALAFWKATLVAKFFMHVKYDPGILAFLCVTPVILATPFLIFAGFDLVKGPNL